MSAKLPAVNVNSRPQALAAVLYMQADKVIDHVRREPTLLRPLLKGNWAGALINDLSKYSAVVPLILRYHWQYFASFGLSPRVCKTVEPCPRRF